MKPGFTIPPAVDAPLAHMADQLFLSLWFSSFTSAEMMPRALSVLRQFPFSQQYAGITYLAVHPVSWGEPTVLEQRFRPGVDPETAAGMASEAVHADHAYVFEAAWDLWTPAADGQPALTPVAVKFILHGLDFAENLYQQAGHLQVDFGLDTPFLWDEEQQPQASLEFYGANVQKLVAFSSALEKNCNLTGRVLWSESDENLAQKLIERLQRLH